MVKTLILMLACVLVIIGAVVMFENKNNIISNGTNPVACTMEAKICPDGSYVGRSGPNCEFAKCPDAKISWEFKESKAQAASGAPQTEVTLVVGAKRYPAGIYQGSCSVVETSSWKLLENEKSGAICWFAGGGEEVGVFQEGDSLVVKKGALDEGDGETGGTRGNFEALFNL